MAYPQPSWKDREHKLLSALAEFATEGIKPSFEQLKVRSGLDYLSAQLGVEALLDGMYITGADARSHDGFDYLNLRLLPEGRRLVGRWPDVTASDMAQTTTGIALFISHASVDADAAADLVELVRSALGLSPSEIRCTSVDGYRLKGGAHTLEQLRIEIFQSRAFIALLSKTSLDSKFVLFELGARWGANRLLLPLLIRGAVPADLPQPIADLNALSGTDDAQMQQLMQDLAGALDRTVQAPHIWHRSLRRTVEAFGRRVDA